MSFVKIIVHAVWATKYREPTLLKEKRQILFQHIQENARSKSIELIAIGGFDEHVHCLIGLNKELTISKTIQLLKGESSNWANKRNIFPTKIIWAEDYFAVSVSVGAINAVKNYIANQEAHHSKTSFNEEFDRFKSHIVF